MISLAEMIALHSLTDNDEFIVVSLGKNSEDAVLHFSGELDTLVELLKLTLKAIREPDILCSNRLH
jgi:hypothetical protein